MNKEKKVTFSDAVRIRKLIDLERQKLKNDANKANILISDEEILVLSERIKSVIKPGIIFSEINPKVQKEIDRYFEHLVQQAE